MRRAPRSGFFWNFKVEMHPQWSWREAYARGWMPANLSHMPAQYFNVCRTETEGSDVHGGGATGDLPWYNALPSAHSSSPVILLMGLGLSLLLVATVLLKMVLNLLEKSSMSYRAQPWVARRSKAARGARGEARAGRAISHV